MATLCILRVGRSAVARRASKPSGDTALLNAAGLARLQGHSSVGHLTCLTALLFACLTHHCLSCAASLRETPYIVLSCRLTILSSELDDICLSFSLSVAVNRREPHFNMVIKNVTIRVGQTAVLPCTVENVGKYKVLWQKNQRKNQKTSKRVLTMGNRRIISDDRITVERPFTIEWNLHLRKVMLSDAGTYECHINTDPVQSSPIQLVVQEPPSISESMSSPTSVRVREGETVELMCNATGTPPPEVIWYKRLTGKNQVQPIIPSIVPSSEDKCYYSYKGIMNQGEVLVIHNASRTCAEVYQCRASNRVDPPAIRSIRVHVEFPPEVFLPTKRIGQSISKPTILECTISAYPHNVNRWRLNGSDIRRDQKRYTIELYKDGDNQVTLTLRINSVAPQDYGTYECYASNLLGEDSETMVLYEYRREKKTMSTTTTTLVPWVDPHNNLDNKYNRVNNRNGNHGYYGGDERHVDPSRVEHPDHREQARQNWADHSNGDTSANRHNSWGKPGRNDFNREAESNSVRAGPRDSASHPTPHSLLTAITLHVLLFYTLMS
ncbi:hypothetical protein RRG08_003255 [Elysia crispata]|uniref:Ig-like domain-containing protein n=1 Tax=Elysia crispata TaxID=231223 RepID=A0AAE1AYR0_9GAST|nr:hypothetical protein RRG08_003255 [Elysia crispata]